MTGYQGESEKGGEDGCGDGDAEEVASGLKQGDQEELVFHLIVVQHEGVLQVWW